MKIGWRQLVGIIVVSVLMIGAGFGLANMRLRLSPTPIQILPPTPQLPAPEGTPPGNSMPAGVLAPSATPGPIHVYVSGAVVQPAVYQLPVGSIIDDAVRAAGGFAVGADTSAVNLAQPAADGMQVHVPLLAENLPTPPPISLPPVGATAVRMTGITLNGLININTAEQMELEMLPGIGPATAANIIAHREANGPFASIESIMDVPGIGEGRFEDLRELITVGP